MQRQTAPILALAVVLVLAVAGSSTTVAADALADVKQGYRLACELERGYDRAIQKILLKRVPLLDRWHQSGCTGDTWHGDPECKAIAAAHAPLNEVLLELRRLRDAQKSVCGRLEQDYLAALRTHMAAFSPPAAPKAAVKPPPARKKKATKRAASKTKKSARRRSASSKRRTRTKRTKARRGPSPSGPSIIIGIGGGGIRF